MLHTLGRFQTLAPISSFIIHIDDQKMIHPKLVKKLEDKGLWSKAVRNKIFLTNGSIETIEKVSNKMRKIFKTSYEISQKALIERAAARGKYICQDEKLELSLRKATPKSISTLIKHAYQEGLKIAFSKINH